MRKYFTGMAAGCVAVWMLAACTGKTVTGDYEVIPIPREVEAAQGAPFVIRSSVRIVYPEGNEKLEKTAGFLAASIQEATGKKLALSTDTSAASGIFLSLDPSFEKPEGYRLHVDKGHVRIVGATEAGVFYGAQTLRKALPQVGEGEAAALPAAVITDYPRFGYRGAMLDVGRHFFPVEFIKKYIDLLALHQINVFHWHLTEDQGWRIEIKKYPKLTGIGSQRKETRIDRKTGQMDGTPYGGYYTQDEAREIVAYAADRFITVIPEIDLPGHSLAVLASYPELGCTGGPYEVATTFGIFDDVLCGGNEQALVLAKDVLDEIMDIFPSSYIHLGGDECPKVRWKKCPKCQARIRSLGLKSDAQHSAEDRLQTWFMSQLQQHIRARGRHMLGWDEMLDGGVPEGATVLAWRNVPNGAKAARLHHPVVVSPYLRLYLSQPAINEWDAKKNLANVYNFDPVPADLSEEDAGYIIGAQVCIWTEWVRTPERVEFLLLPRLDAASEIFWSGAEQKDYDSFLRRLPRMLDRYDAWGINYRKEIRDSIPAPVAAVR